MNGNRPTEIKVKLKMNDHSEIIKGSPVSYKNNSILLKPILDHIYWLGKKIKNFLINYYSEEDECDTFAGVYGKVSKTTAPLRLKI